MTDKKNNGKIIVIYNGEFTEFWRQVKTTDGYVDVYIKKTFIMNESEDMLWYKSKGYSLQFGFDIDNII